MKHATLALGLVVSACGSGLDAPAPSRLSPPITASNPTEAPAAVCAVGGLPADTIAVRGAHDGLWIGHGGVASRTTGSGCAQTLEAGGYAMTEADLDVDDAGNLYLMPGRAEDPAITAVDVDFAGVVRVDRDGVATKLVDRGRWVAGFSIAPGGDELTVYGCAATGLHREASDGWHLDRDVSVKAQEAGGVGETALAVGDGAILMAIDGTLLRVTATGSAKVGRAAVDFGQGTPESPRALTRCGSVICGVYDGGVAVLDADGALLRALSRAELGVAAAERIEQATSDAHGWYVLLSGPSGARVVFAAERGAVR